MMKEPVDPIGERNLAMAEDREKRKDVQVEGSATRTLVGTVIIGCVGLASAVLLASTRNALKPRMPLLLSPFPSQFMVAAPNLFGSLFRIPYAILLETVSSRLLHISCMCISGAGVLGLMVISFLTQDAAELGLAVYVAYVVCGVVGGVGLASFSIGITTVAFWSPMRKQGAMNGIYGGATNLAPGLMGLWVAKSVAWSLGFTYVIWLALVVVATVVAAPLICNSPYHQLLFAHKKDVKEGGAALTDADYEEMKTRCHQDYEQDLFPTGNVLQALLGSARSLRTWALVYLYNVSFGGFLCFTVYFPSFYVDTHETSLTIAGWLGALFTLLAAGIRIPAGFVSDRITFANGGVVVEAVALALIIVGALVIMLVHSFAVNIVGMLVIACGIGCANAATYKMLPKLCRGSVAGTSGWVAGVGAFGGVVWPLIMGLLQRAFGHQNGSFVLFVVNSALALVMLAAIAVQMRKDEVAAADAAAAADLEEMRPVANNS